MTIRPPGDRRTAARRKDDREGGGPTPAELQARNRLNKATGFFLVLTGGLVIGGSFRSLLQGGESAQLSVVLALVAMGYGVYLIARRERRRGSRRHLRSPAAKSPREKTP